MRFFRKSILAKILAVFFTILFISLSAIMVHGSIDIRNRILNSAKESEQLLSSQLEHSAETLFATTETTLQGLSRESSVTNILVSDRYKEMILEDFKKYEATND